MPNGDEPNEWKADVYNTPDWDWLLRNDTTIPAIREGEVTLNPELVDVTEGEEIQFPPPNP